MHNIKPTLVLSIISTVIAAILIISSNVFAVDESVLSDAMKKKCINLAGEGEYYIVTNWFEAGYNIEQPKDVKKLIKNENGDVLLEVVANGYAKSGINILVSMNIDGSVKGIEVVELKETPGLGDKIKNIDFIEKFIGADSPKTAVKISPKNDSEVQTIAGATYSSRGMVNAVNLAIQTYNEMGGNNE